MRLRRDLEGELHRRIKAELKGEADMPYLSSLERFAIERGEQQGLEKGLQQGMEKGMEKGLREAIGMFLKSRFGDRALPLLPRLEEIRDAGRLRSLIRALPQIESLDAFEGLLDRP